MVDIQKKEMEFNSISYVQAEMRKLFDEKEKEWIVHNI